MLIDPADKLRAPAHPETGTPEDDSRPIAGGTEPRADPALRAIAIAICILFSGLVWAALAALF